MGCTNEINFGVQKDWYLSPRFECDLFFGEDQALKDIFS